MPEDSGKEATMYKMLEHPEIGWIERTGYPSWLQDRETEDDEYDSEEDDSDEDNYSE